MRMKMKTKGKKNKKSEENLATAQNINLADEIRKNKNAPEKISGFVRELGKKTFIYANIELRNGDVTTIKAVFKGYDGFLFGNDRYIYDNRLIYYNLSLKGYCLDYHQDFCLPIKRHVPVDDIRDTVVASDDSISGIQYATNPSLLEKFINSKIIENIMQATQINSFLKQMRLILIVCAIASVLHLMLYLKNSGVLDNII